MLAPISCPNNTKTIYIAEYHEVDVKMCVFAIFVNWPFKVYSLSLFACTDINLIPFMHLDREKTESLPV